MSNVAMRQLGMRDLSVIVFLVALHLATCKLAVDYRRHWICGFEVLAPLALTTLLQIRFHLSLPFATMIHYPLCLGWAFLNGVIYSMYWNRLPHDFFERDSVGIDSPLRYGLFCVEVWAFVGIGTTALYGFGGWFIRWFTRARLSRKVIGDDRGMHE